MESSGCISPAVSPHVITDTQTVPIPRALNLDDDLPSEVLEIIENLEGRTNEPAASEERQSLAYDRTQELENALTTRFLPGVTGRRRQSRPSSQLCSRLPRRQRPSRTRSPVRYSRRLHAPDQVLSLLDAAPRRRHD